MPLRLLYYRLPLSALSRAARGLAGAISRLSLCGLWPMCAARTRSRGMVRVRGGGKGRAPASGPPPAAAPAPRRAARARGPRARALAN